MVPSLILPAAGAPADEPLRPALDRYDHFDVTTNIGTEFTDLQLSDIINDNDAIRDLAILVSQRNVVFLRNQSINVKDQQILAQKLGVLSGKPAESGLHIHPLSLAANQLGDYVSIISSKKLGKPIDEFIGDDRSKLHSLNIHSDITFERWGSDYAILKLVQVPKVGGDTLWFSGYEVYDRLSTEFRQFLEGLTAQHSAEFFYDVAKAQGSTLRTDVPRGHPENIGGDFESTHPVIRTNPVTKWKSVFVSRSFTKRINGVTRDESDIILDYLFKLQAENHDLAVRFKWNQNDVAIWDNRSTFHSATFDIVGERKGERVVSIGERPYYDPSSKSRREALGLKPAN